MKQTILYISNMRLPTERAHGAQVMHMCSAFASAGAEVTLCVPTRKTHITEDPFLYYTVKKNFSIKRVFSFDLARFGSIGFLIQSISFGKFSAWYALRTRPDIVYSRDEWPLFFLSFFRRGLYFEAHDGRLNFITRTILKRVDGVITISEGLRHFYRTRGISDTNIFVAHDGIDTAMFANEVSQSTARSALHLPNEKKIAMYIGSLETWKGYVTLLETSAMTDAFIVTIIGGKKDQIAVLEKEYPKVIFLGQRPYAELPINQRAADVLIVPNTAKDPLSRDFTSPLKVFAHMTSGVPIVASDVPSIRETLSEETAILVSPDNPQALLSGIQAALASPDISNRIARAAKEKVQSYDWKNRAQNILSFIQKHT